MILPLFSCPQSHPKNGTLAKTNAHICLRNHPKQKTKKRMSKGSAKPRYVEVIAVSSWFVRVSKLRWFKPFTKAAKAKKAEPIMKRMVPISVLLTGDLGWWLGEVTPVVL